jgi:hypothetical protein
MAHSSGLSYEDQIRKEVLICRRDKNEEGLVYYLEILESSDTSACASFEVFKESWAYSVWIKKQSTKTRIERERVLLGIV